MERDLALGDMHKAAGLHGPRAAETGVVALPGQSLRRLRRREAHRRDQLAACRLALRWMVFLYLTCHHGNKVGYKPFHPKNVPLLLFGVTEVNLPRAETHWPDNWNSQQDLL